MVERQNAFSSSLTLLFGRVDTTRLLCLIKLGGSRIEVAKLKPSRASLQEPSFRLGGEDHCHDQAVKLDLIPTDDTNIPKFLTTIWQQKLLRQDETRRSKLAFSGKKEHTLHFPKKRLCVGNSLGLLWPGSEQSALPPSPLLYLAGVDDLWSSLAA